MSKTRFNAINYRQFLELRSDLIASFWEKIDKSGSTPESQQAMNLGRVTTPCHIWLASINLEGYGQYMWRELKANKTHHCLPHTLVYFLTTNDLPQERGLQLDHTCRIFRCCNMDHIKIVDQLETGRHVNPNEISKAIIDQVMYLHSSVCAWSIFRIADYVGLSPRIVSKILVENSQSGS